MQLKLTFLLMLFIPLFLFAEEEKNSVKETREKIKIDLLFNYYDQDGNHSPVTAGKGTEDQQVIAPMLKVFVPMGKKQDLSLDFGVDNITSASTDRIDGTTSSASEVDNRVHGNITYNRYFDEKKHRLGAMLGISTEWDVKSLQAGLQYGFLSNNENHEWNASISYYKDQWDLIWPIEFRANSASLPQEDVRNSFNLSLNYHFVITKTLQASVLTDFTIQDGLLSTPFHRVLFSDATTDIERLPDSRFKTAIGFRLHKYWTEHLMTRFYYRYYFDDFDINSHTFELELPLKLNTSWTFTPGIRFYMQSEAKYFASYGENNSSSAYHTSDYDLSDFSSLLYSLNVKYTPLWGNLVKSFRLDSIETRLSLYDRDDGLNAFNISLGFSFSF